MKEGKIILGKGSEMMEVQRTKIQIALWSLETNISHRERCC